MLPGIERAREIILLLNEVNIVVMKRFLYICCQVSIAQIAAVDLSDSSHLSVYGPSPPGTACDEFGALKRKHDFLRLSFATVKELVDAKQDINYICTALTHRHAAAATPTHSLLLLMLLLNATLLLLMLLLLVLLLLLLRLLVLLLPLLMLLMLLMLLLFASMFVCLFVCLFVCAELLHLFVC